MKIKFKKEYLIGIFVCSFVVLLDILYFWKTRWFFAMIILALSIGWSQFWMDFFKEQKRQKEIEEKFVELVRTLVGTVKSGISIPQALRQTADKDYGALTKYTRKLANQLEWGIPVDEALLIFSKDTGNTTIKRAVSIVLEAEKSGGDIENVLESVTDSVVHVKKMKAERRAETYSQMVQGYIVFFVFIGIMLLLQIKLFPMLAGMSGAMSSGLGSMDMLGSVFGEGEQANLDKIFFSMLMIQGLFAGIMIGKFSEGTIKQGLAHSLALMTISALIVTLVKGGI
ncbi:MAG: type II secretion system F family protein [Nanoarchaeota archaeon]|nr:type II secretion system F family protein [Nanoarchaeota archaeon]